MPHATATVNGVVVAETDTWEVVDGNIYVRLFLPSSYSPSLLRFPPLSLLTLYDAVPAQRYQQVTLHPYIYDDALSVQGRCELLHRDDEQDGGQGCGMVLPRATKGHGENQGVCCVL
jgi:hypothetical protein